MLEHLPIIPSEASYYQVSHGKPRPTFSIVGTSRPESCVQRRGMIMSRQPKLKGQKDKIKRMRELAPHSTFAVVSGRKCEFFQLTDIYYCSGQGNYTQIHLISGRKITSSKILKEIEEALPSDAFIRIHNSYIVNITFVRQLSTDPEPLLTLTDGTQLPVSRRRRKLLMERFISL